MIFSPSRFAVMAACALPLLAPLFHAPAHAQQTPRVLSEAATEGMRLRIERAPQHGLVAAPLDIAALRLNGSLHKPRVLGSDGAEILSQWVPESGVSSRGLLLLQLPRGGNFDLQVRAGEAINTLAPAPQTFVARNSQAELAFDAAREGGFPSRISYLKSGRTIEGFLWRDRIYNGTEYSLRHDKNARLEYAAEGPLATVVRNRARYVAENGAAPASAPEATYTWILWKAQPLIEVRALATQSRATRWNEAHFLEFHFNDASFDRFLGGEPTRSETLKADKKGHEFGQWGALRIGDDVLAQVGKRAIIYDGRGDYGTYLLLGNPAPFAPWNDTTRTAAATFFIGTEAAAETALPRMAQENAAAPRVLATANAFEARLQKLRAQAARQAPSQKRETLWRIALAERALFSGDETRASAWLGTTSPADSSRHRAGDFGLALRRTAGGVQLESLFDLARGRELLAQSTPALWNLTVREKAAALSIQARREMSLNAQEGWGRVEIVPATATRPLSIAWSDSSDAALRGVRVIATATPDARASAWRWNLSVKNENRNWGISRAVFPQLALADEGENTRALYPQGSGIAMKNPSARNLNYAMDYPFGWATMQMLAVYHGGSAPHGLYVAMHDPRASTKRINMVGDAAQSALQLNYEHPAPRIDEVAVDFQMGGQAVWQLLRGDWFDAAQIYKSWAQKNATWWPKLGKEGREDTPLWMRRLAGWGLIDVRHQPNFVESALSLRRDWGMPIGVHLYQWHQIPFDNDYPHYFPVRDAFPAGVKALQAQGVHAMPYINGRLWDTRDKGTEDFEYSARALPWATKVEKDGKLVAFTEKYGSKESNGSDVELAAMCPSTSFWQDELRRIVLRLTKEYGTDAVYMDQIAAAQPVLCRDPSHPHPAGGGDWWAPSYNEMLRKIRAELPAGKMLTTECNAEPYIKSFDGYLTWHWQYNEQVALFPAVYGGAIQMFGRAYGAGPDAARAMRMRAAQQLMWGEQIGWVNPEFVLQASGEAEFMRRVVKLRDSQARFFYAGAMARPPRLGNNLPQVTADWQWQGTQIVTTDAAMSGLWKIAGERKALLMVSNVSENPVEIALDTAALDVGTRAVQIAPLPVEGITVPALQRGINRLILPPRAVYAWNVSW